MALQFELKKLDLIFNFDARTSRGPLRDKETWIIKVYDSVAPSICGYGECGPLAGLSIDDFSDIEDKIRSVLKLLQGQEMQLMPEGINLILDQLPNSLPALIFGVEVALLDLVNGGIRKIYDTAFYNDEQSIKINGLIWIAEKENMIDQLRLKLDHGFDCIKLKIGSMPFEDELSILEEARAVGEPSKLSIRVDANGAYSVEEIPAILDSLARLQIHSIEQPIKAGQPEQMAILCENNTVPIALDEELIGLTNKQNKQLLLEKIKPQYIILKPTLLGGFRQTQEWITLAEQMNIGWWVTSALESNIGLNAICQFTDQFNSKMAQGLGTGGLYKNNIDSPLEVLGGFIKYDPYKHWDQQFFNQEFYRI